ncbi:MAG: DUF4142 domain-containing protein [Alphaproteobacteria bacterium]
MKRSFPSLLTIMLALVFICSPAWANKKEGMRKPVSTQNFIMRASAGNQFEVASSKLALEKSQTDSVKQFAQRMIDDHAAAETKLKMVMPKEKSSESSTVTGVMDNKQQEMLDELGKLSGADFDRRYIEMQTKAHKKAVHLFENYAENGSDSNLKTFAKETLETIKKHHMDVKNLKPS